MVNLNRLLYSFLSTNPISQIPLDHRGNDAQSQPPKSIAIVGAGSAGLAILKTLLDIDPTVRQNWNITLYEERENVGGIWLPDKHNVKPPDIPETPLYPLLHTNTPVPSMAYPGFPFLPGTPLYPSHEHVEAYHLRYAQHYNLLESIKFKHRIVKASWKGTEDNGNWNLTVSSSARTDQILQHQVDHLIVATGDNHFPSSPTWKGQDEWLSNQTVNHSRKIIHSVYYREPQAFTNQNILVVGNGGSGRDAALQTVGLAKQVWQSVRHSGDIIDGVIIKPDISHFTSSGVVFVDGSIIDPDVVILGTGYELLKPFLTLGDELLVNASTRDNSSSQSVLTTNLRYIFPLHKHILSLNSRYPTNALAFIGLPSYIANCPSNVAQSEFVAQVILNPEILPSRTQLLKELSDSEDNLRRLGVDPYTNGHRMISTTASADYQDSLIDFLKEKKAIPDDGNKFVERWRRDIFIYIYLRRGLARIETLRTGSEWTKDIATEAQWADLMKRINEWQEQWELEQGIVIHNEMGWAG